MKKLKESDRSKWVLLLPFALFGLACWLFVESQIEVRVQFERAREQWREGKYQPALEMYRTIVEKFPRSELAPEALWEVATIYYYNIYDVSNALFYFERLVENYPDSPRAVDGHLKIAEIFEIELNEVPKALEHLTALLSMKLTPAEDREVRFRIAELHFKTSEFAKALAEYRSIIAEKEPKHLVHQARIRVATISRIQGRFDESIRIFQEVLRSDPCSSCRLQAQLGIIESFELTDRLVEAIEVARQIDVQVYPREKRDELLERLLEKRKYYEPGLWNGR